MNRNKLRLAVAAALFGLFTSASAEVISAKGKAEVSIKASGGDLIAARRVAKAASEIDAVIAAIKLKLNINPNDPKSKKAIDDFVNQLSDNLKTSMNVEGDILVAKTTLEVDSATIMDLARSSGIGSQTAVAQARVLFIIDEYKGIATAREAGQAVETEVEYSHDKSSFSDRSAKASGAESASAASSSSSKSANAYSSKEAAAVSAKESSAVSAKKSGAVSGSESAAYSSKQSAAVAASNPNSRVAGAASSQEAGAANSSYKASGSASLNAASSSSVNAASSSQKAGASSSQRADASSSASASKFSAEQKDVAEQKDIVNYKVTSKFPDVNNATPSEGADELIAARLEQVAGNHGIQFTSERDFRVEGGRRLLIRDIERLSKVDYYLQKAAKGSYNAKYVAFGTAVMNTEGKLPNGRVGCGGQLKLQVTNVDTGQGLPSATIVKSAAGNNDQDCQANLATALATSVAETVGSAAQREIQRVATQGSSFEVVLYSALKVPPKVRKAFKEQLAKVAGDIAEGNATENQRSYTVQAKGNFKSDLEDFLDELKEQLPELKDARMDSRGTIVYICVEGKCPQ